MESLRTGDPTQVGSYRIAARLGSGGMGSVYLGRSRGGRSVAVKVIRPELAQDPDFRRRFAREVDAARLVNGVYTAGVIDADPNGDPPWLATAYVAGPSLSEAVRDHGPWPEASVLALAAGVAEALEAIHVHGVVHRDLKPSNVLLCADGPRVIDFGISAVTEAATELTRAGTVIGTPGFMAPEQLTGERVTAATDVFSLGALLAFTATGTGPFGTGTAPGLMYRVVHDEPDLGALPARLRDLVGRCLSKDPARRPTVSALLDQLAAGPDAADGLQWLPPQLARLLFAPARSGSPSVPRTLADPRTPGDAPTPVDPRTPVGLSKPAVPPGSPTPTGPPTPTPTPTPTPVDPAAATRTASPAAPRPADQQTPPPPRQTPPPPRPAGQGQQPAPPSMPPSIPPLVPPQPPVVHDTVRGSYGPAGPAGPAGARSQGRVLAAVGAAVAAVGLLAWLVPRALDTATTGASRPPSAPSSSSASTPPSFPPSPAAGSGPTGRAATGGTRTPVIPAPPTPAAQTLPVVGSWQGTYLCGQGLTRLDLKVTSPGGHALAAVFTFSAHPDNPGVPNGSFTMVGSFENGRMTLRGDRWVDQPAGYLMVDLEASVAGDRPAVLSGAVVSSVASCTQFVVGRQG
ncbi:serine/threonine-protein kinase [Streptomyces sp. CB00455]|uniref:serine/threonine-protein kinase n=1 Tax=Streptomyces sp. CB00455 TaxID=1703927 RepID=UPI000B1F22E2|nr:serine/threonine-protein kinase [Streptomyces sp. CB00455]